ncbi:hypothetical protein BBM13_10820 [Vibrio parahaemolyticus]|uniref:hypothetical protein n=1 Tax=Vibrio parahaemolyticus TaxID=670 RepID=UPI0004A3E31A|nr:hypothetical protein [Vibrio parahaemolyticus]MBE3977030.1 hypothetical protein [Vibrio parahaemolyticus]ODX73443.1 hypothetical protein BBM12_20030 [Vibrio parahaemolyticus]ODX89629.1 hypothetical protein BBM13_10820 [Vibrio parahaemolyticus]ODX92220.1 hypothetical protein BBM93_04045 [Vibrio parahaemolyticus]ODY00228.1 hypothetical protein BBM14_11905 [Vibrio parahaemolyticus]
MKKAIRVNFFKYVFFELSFVCFLAFCFYWASVSYELLELFTLISALAVIVKSMLLWWKLRSGTLEVSGSFLYFNGSPCEVNLLPVFLPFNIGGAVKVSYMVSAMQKRSFNIPKSAVNQSVWNDILKHRT